MINIKDAKLVLFTLFEPADLFWSNEILRCGAVEVYYQITQGQRYLKHPNFKFIQSQIHQADPAKLRDQITQAGGWFMTSEDSDWPLGLDDLVLPPIGLVISGERCQLAQVKSSLAIVGSRKPTKYGLVVADKLARECVASSLSVVSGGAYGIDTAAHKGALDAGGITIAVLASGLNHFYPIQNQRLFKQIQQQGLLITEVMPNVTSAPHRFLIRNRLIAALSKATVVVEAQFVSGSIRTARDAAEIFRPVFAIPGPISSPLSEGCHRLIAERVADIATSLNEILELITPLQLR